MSTRSVIAREVPGGGFAGRYIHFDGYPSRVGAKLWELYRARFGRDINLMLTNLIYEHPAGWSILAADWSLPFGSSASASRCYCHGECQEEAFELTDKDAARSSCEYVYSFGHSSDGRNIMQIMVPVGEFLRERWVAIAVLEIDDDEEPDWKRFDKMKPDEKN